MILAAGHASATNNSPIAGLSYARGLIGTGLARQTTHAPMTDNTSGSITVPIRSI
jgi:hypothetical protein